MTTEKKCNSQLEQQYQQQWTTRRNANTVESNTCRSNAQRLVKHAENVGKRITGSPSCNARIIGENQTTEDYVIEALKKEVGKKTMKADVRNEVKKIRYKEEKSNEKMKKNKQQLDDDGSMEKNKKILYDDRTAINKKQQTDSMTRGYDAQKKEATLVMKMNDKNVRIQLDTGAEVNVMPTRVFSQIANTEDIGQSNVRLKGYGGSAISVIGESFIRCAYNHIYKDVKFYIVESSCKTALG